MASLDVTPQELRDIEIREAWRGYHRDDVDELLERAAATIEHLEDENRQLKARLSQAPAGAKQPAAAPAPKQPVAAEPAPLPPVRTAETDVIQRTLVLAQKAADEAVAEARAKAQQMLAESESKADSMVAEAEATAQRVADTEKAKLEVEITRLAETRDTLTADVDALERFAVEYRERLRVAIEAELELLRSTSGDGGTRPTPSRVELPRAESTWSASQEGALPAPVSTSSARIEGVQAYTEYEDAGDVSEPAGGWDAQTAALVDDSGEHEVADDHAHDDGLAPRGDHEDTGQHESLDDDAFFASLREAVRDDSPLGSDDDATAFFEQDDGDGDEERKLFRRRR
jgi:DivIVA domain-containing protein